MRTVDKGRHNVDGIARGRGLVVFAKWLRAVELQVTLLGVKQWVRLRGYRNIKTLLELAAASWREADIVV